jgi:hypothetical protein
MRRVDPDDSDDPLRMAHRHLPDDEAAPIVADENRSLDPQMVEQRNEIAGEMIEVVIVDRRWPRGVAIAALIRCDHADAGLAQCPDLMSPRERQLGPAVA